MKEQEMAEGPLCVYLLHITNMREKNYNGCLKTSVNNPWLLEKSQGCWYKKLNLDSINFN